MSPANRLSYIELHILGPAAHSREPTGPLWLSQYTCCKLRHTLQDYLPEIILANDGQASVSSRSGLASITKARAAGSVTRAQKRGFAAEHTIHCYFIYSLKRRRVAVT